VAQEVRKCDAKIKEITGGKVKTVQKKLEDAKKQLDKIKKEITRLEVEIKDGERQLKKSLDQVRCLLFPVIFKHTLKNSICPFATFQNSFYAIGHSLHLWVFYFQVCSILVEN
jgi:hypothetical protein